MCSLVIIILSLVGDKGLIQLQALKKQEARLEEEIGKLVIERQEWLTKVQALKNNTTYFETIAREELGMVKKGELAFQIEYYGK